MPETAIWWVRHDLRLHDNPTLAAASEADHLLAVYCFDPAAYGNQPYGGSDDFTFQKTGSHRAQFHREAVDDLRASLRERGSDLLVRHGDPATEIAAVVDAVDADRLHAQRLPAPEEVATEGAVREAVGDDVAVETHWTHTLYHPDDLPSPPAEIQDTYTPFRKAVEADSDVRPTVETPSLPPLPESAPEAGSIPTLADLDSSLSPPEPDDHAGLGFEGGETAGKARLQHYLWEADRLREYKETRNGLRGADFSSKLSAWLAAGCLSPRHIAAEVGRYETERVANDSTYWLVFELLWRDFFQFQVAKYGGQYFAKGGLQERDGLDWRDPDDEPAANTAFDQWCAGETGIPFVDAAMRELNATGYQSNRARQNAASFLANDLGIDWRRGAAYFETQLVDYDPCSNYGNWAYIAGVGNDSRDRAFNILWQADRYDPDAAYVTHWLPELAGLPARYAHAPWTMSDAEQSEYGVELGSDYPEPTVRLEIPDDVFDE
ncbi:DASH family cryptochrome [Halonotius terrestris]|uniref:Cryptochrome DASH n=1 Tax=Halonotius terrestris TaxID=2487750 RepID=A0A8J8PBF8_9EURY|nr:DASH family cryptochrome [Halonotius terrestris]TQQ83463.1 DASH family cryptochrome [Halonotius terrestris]